MTHDTTPVGPVADLVPADLIIRGKRLFIAQVDAGDDPRKAEDAAFGIIGDLNAVDRSIVWSVATAHAIGTVRLMRAASEKADARLSEIRRIIRDEIDSGVI